jgi:hypothetical protein
LEIRQPAFIPQPLVGVHRGIGGAFLVPFSGADIKNATKRDVMRNRI